MMNRRRSRTRTLVGAGVGCLLALAAQAQMADSDAPLELPEFPVRSERIANQEPSATMDMPVSALRFEPRVDVQGRNLAEAQADIAIRGGIFENTGFRLGALALGDPQTGHYFAEIPVPPRMLGPVQVLTGAQNAIRGFNASVGTVAYAWRPIAPGGFVSVGAGQNRFNRQSVYLATASELSSSERTLGVDVDLSRSESDGTVDFGDHDFRRAAVRLQVRGALSQTDVFAGYQTKFFGWPNLYTPFAGFRESEDLETFLVALNHVWRDAQGNELELGAYHRRHRDDYEFNRFAPNTLFEHTTWVYGASVAGRLALGAAAVRYGADVSTDDIDSTALTYGRFSGRSNWKLSFVPEWSRPLAHGDTLTLRAGANYDDSNRHGAVLSPIVGIERAGHGRRVYLEYAQAAQFPTYTALNSNPAAGLFRGNRDLGATRSHNLELGASLSRGAWQVEAAAFHRRDDDLVDWTFPGVRTATALDLDTYGLEVVVAYRSARFDAVAGYQWLRKRTDFDASVTGSYYALNFPRHRLTAAFTWRLGLGVELRFDNEVRTQERNVLRTTGDEALLSNWGIYYLPPRLRGWEFSLLVDNVWDDDFQEVPSVPASRRQISGGVSHRW